MKIKLILFYLIVAVTNCKAQNLSLFKKEVFIHDNAVCFTKGKGGCKVHLIPQRQSQQPGQRFCRTNFAAVAVCTASIASIASNI